MGGGGGGQKNMSSMGNGIKDPLETHGSLQEGPNGDRETTEADRRDGQPLGNKGVPVGKGG
jgi:hypothetical protein